MSTPDNPFSTPVDGPPYHMGPPDRSHLLPDDDWREIVEYAEQLQRDIEHAESVHKEAHTGNSETSETPNNAGVIETSGVIVNDAVGPISKNENDG